ncbi:MAG: hypothetical protein WD004_00795 [Actinomycetota bacterium]
MRVDRRLALLRVILVLIAVFALKLAIDQLRSPAFGRPGWLVPAAVAGLLFSVAARIPVGLPFRVGRPLLLGIIPAVLILNSMLAFEGYHLMPTGLHFGPVFGWTLYSEGMLALAVLVGVALASGFARVGLRAEDVGSA